MNRVIGIVVLLVAVGAFADDKNATFRIEGQLEGTSPATATEVAIAVRISCKEGSHRFLLGSKPQVFGMYVLGPWGPVQPDLSKVRPENWMHQQHSAASPITITPDKPFETKLRFSDYFPVNDGSIFRPGRYQLNVKFYSVELGMEQPIDAGPFTFSVPAAKQPGRESDDYLNKLNGLERSPKELQQSKVPDAELAVRLADAAWFHDRGLLAEESLKVRALFRVGRDMPGFASKSDWVWEVRVEHLLAGFDGIVLVNAQTAEIMVFPASRGQ